MLNHQNTLSTKAYPINKQKPEEEHSNIVEIMNEKSPINIAHVTNSENKLLGSDVDILFSSIITTPSLASLLPSRVANPAVWTNINKESDSEPEKRTASLNGLEHLVNDDSSSAEHDVITMLAGNQDERNDTFFENQGTSNQSSSQPNSNRNQKRSRRTINIVHEIESSANTTLIATYRIISKYLPGQPVAFSISDRLATLPLNETISLSGLLTMTSAKKRPNRKEQLEMIEELGSSCLYSVTRPKHNAFIIKRIANDKQNQ